MKILARVLDVRYNMTGQKEENLNNMPNLASAKKRLRQNAAKQLRNQVAKTRIKTEIKKALSGSENVAVSVIDRAASKGIIHKNKAARQKSRLAKRLATASTAE